MRLLCGGLSNPPPAHATTHTRTRTPASTHSTPGPRSSWRRARSTTSSASALGGCWATARCCWAVRRCRWARSCSTRRCCPPATHPTTTSGSAGLAWGTRRCKWTRCVCAGVVVGGVCVSPGGCRGGWVGGGWRGQHAAMTAAACMRYTAAGPQARVPSCGPACCCASPQ